MKKSSQICSPSPKNKIRERKLWWRTRIGRKRRIKSRRTLKSLPQNRDCSSLNPFFGSPFSFSFQSITSLLSTFSSQQLLFLEATIDLPLIGSSPIPTLLPSPPRGPPAPHRYFYFLVVDRSSAAFLLLRFKTLCAGSFSSAPIRLRSAIPSFPPPPISTYFRFIIKLRRYQMEKKNTQVYLPPTFQA
ncbi:hypothetical protein LXL04_017942 [Taraxacum kok-saghyz]